MRIWCNSPCFISVLYLSFTQVSKSTCLTESANPFFPLHRTPTIFRSLKKCVCMDNERSGLFGFGLGFFVSCEVVRFTYSAVTFFFPDGSFTVLFDIRSLSFYLQLFFLLLEHSKVWKCYAILTCANNNLESSNQLNSVSS